MAVERTRPRIAVSNMTPYCEAEVTEGNIPNWHRERRRRLNAVHGREPNQCGKRSSYAYDGKHYCHAHMGVLAIKILMEDT